MPKHDARTRLRVWMKKSATTQDQLAEMVGTSQANISRWLGGSIPTVEHAVGLERVTGIPCAAWVEHASAD